VERLVIPSSGSSKTSVAFPRGIRRTAMSLILLLLIVALLLAVVSCFVASRLPLAIAVVCLCVVELLKQGVGG